MGMYARKRFHVRKAKVNSPVSIIRVIRSPMLSREKRRMAIRLDDMFSIVVVASLFNAEISA
jgi:hypothetical protein